jgi:hypothetical protein
VLLWLVQRDWRYRSEAGVYLPVSTLIDGFPIARHGCGMAIMGFGGGAM